MSRDPLRDVQSLNDRGYQLIVTDDSYSVIRPDQRTACDGRIGDAGWQKLRRAAAQHGVNDIPEGTLGAMCPVAPQGTGSGGGRPTRPR